MGADAAAGMPSAAACNAKALGSCLQAGFSANHVIIKTLNQIRSHYIQRVGLATYLSQMLGPMANAQLQYCTLYDERGREIELHLNGNRNVPLQRFIVRNFAWNSLPTMCWHARCDLGRSPFTDKNISFWIEILSFQSSILGTRGRP